MDPFSLVTGVTSLADICVRLIKYLREIKDAAGSIGKEIEALQREVSGLELVNHAVEDLWATRGLKIENLPASEVGRIENLWRGVSRALNDCQTTVEQVGEMVSEIVGKQGLTVQGKFDALRKGIRRQSKDEDLKTLRGRISQYQNIVMALLTALNLIYTRNSRETAQQSFSAISEKLELLGLKLQSQISYINRQPDPTNGGYFQDLTSPATAVASTFSLNKHFYIPQSVRSIFTGRESFLEELKIMFNVSAFSRTRSIQKRFIIVGLGGSGKTQFCCKFAQLTQRYFWGIFCIDASSHENAINSFAEISKVAGVEPNERAAKSWLSSLERPWLLIIDSADDPQISIEDYFPSGERGCILVTTRNPENKVHGNVGPGFYHFEKLPKKDASELLLKAAGEKSPWNSSQTRCAADITDELGCLPLALIHAGKAILRKLCSMSDYLNYYRRSWEKVRLARASRYWTKMEDDSMNVYSSFELLYQGLEKSGSRSSRDAIELLNIFSFLHHENIDLELLTGAVTNSRLEREIQATADGERRSAKPVFREKPWSKMFKEQCLQQLENILRYPAVGRRLNAPAVLPAVLRDDETLSPFDEDRLRAALVELSRISLISEHGDKDVYSMHPLVHTWVRERQMTGEQAISCEAAVVTLMQCVILQSKASIDAEEDRPTPRALLPHILHVLRCKQEIAARYRERCKNRLNMFQEWCSPYFGRTQALQLAKISLVYSKCGLFTKAAELQEKVRDFVCGKLGTDHPASVQIMLALAFTYWQLSRFNEAAELQSQVLSACERLFGPDDFQTLKVADTLGTSCSFQGRFKESLELHQRAIKGLKRIRGIEDEDTLIAIDHLGVIYWRYFRYEESAECHKEAIAGLSKKNPTGVATLFAKQNLAMAYLEMGGDLVQQAHEIMVEVHYQTARELGKEHPWTLLAIMSLCRVKSAIGRSQEAWELMKPALEIAERNLGKDHFGTLAGKTHMARIMARLRRFDEAEKMFNTVIEIQRYQSISRADGEHPDRIMALWYLLECYEMQNKFDGAIRVCDELSGAIQRIGGQGLGLQHPITKRLLDKRKTLEDARESKLPAAVAQDSAVNTEIPQPSADTFAPGKLTPSFTFP